MGNIINGSNGGHTGMGTCDKGTNGMAGDNAARGIENVQVYGLIINGLEINGLLDTGACQREN